MTPLFLYVIFPLVTIFAAIIIETIIRRPFIVSLIVFTVFFILAFTIFTPTFVLAAMVYAIIAYIVAVTTEISLRNINGFLRINFGDNICYCNYRGNGIGNSLFEDALGESNKSNNNTDLETTNNHFINNRIIKNRLDDDRLNENSNSNDLTDMLGASNNNNVCNCRFCRMRRNV